MSRRSIGGQFGLVIIATVVTVGVAGYFAGRSILAQVAALADDKPVIEALTAGRQALIDLHHERRAKAEAQIEVCKRAFVRDAAQAGHVPRCDLPGLSPAGIEVGVEDADPSRALPHWETESVYVFDLGGQPVRARFDWPALRPRFAAITDVIGTRDHVTALLPTLTESFLAVFAAALVASGLLGLSVTWILSRRVARRVEELVAYTRRIAGGELVPAPAATRGSDEIGALADAMHRMARDLDDARQRLVLSEKMQSWQAVARKVAHEIKNPLTPISLLASELKKRASTVGAAGDAGTSELLDEASRVLAEETESLGRMVREFSAFARLPEPDLAAGDLTEIVRDFVARNASDAAPVFVVKAPDEPLPAVLDRAMITQVLHNLVNNARLACAPRRATVTFDLARVDSMCVLDARDDGPGVPESLRASLFDAYVTSRSTGDGEKGMGLGLTISRKIAVDHGGALTLHATGSDGTTFRLTLPSTARWDKGGLG